jgi:serine phosphatase RsbU (regulator of sigma subunit)
LGAFSDATFRETEVMLQADDRLVFLTDGMLERNAKELDLIAALGETAHLHPREATRHLADSVLNATGGALADDATLMMLDWHGTDAPRRTTDSGADVDTS